MATADSPPSSPKSPPSPPNPIPSHNSNIPVAVATPHGGILTLALPATAAPRPPPPPPSSTSSRRIPPPCWTHEETLALIDSYREKWYSLRRGNLRANHWEEVADAVSSRCQHLIAASATNPKTSVQCRHKIEKLRKRYRAERQRSLRIDPISPPASSWVYFRKMDGMEIGPATVTAAAASRTPLSAPPRSGAPAPPSSSSEDDSESDDDDDDDDDDDGIINNLRAHTFRSTMTNGNSRGVGQSSRFRFKIPKPVRSNVNVPLRSEERASNLKSTSHFNSNNGGSFFKGYPAQMLSPEVEEMKRRLEKRKRGNNEGGSVTGQMAAAVRMLGDGFMRMEQMRMDMTREIEKLRMEMEIKHTEMILDSQRRILDAFVKSLVGEKRAKVSPGS